MLSHKTLLTLLFIGFSSTLSADNQYETALNGDTLYLSLRISWDSEQVIRQNGSENVVSIPWFHGAFLHDSISIPEFRYVYPDNRLKHNAASAERLQWVEENNPSILQTLYDQHVNTDPQVFARTVKKRMSTEFRWIPYFTDGVRWYRVTEARIRIFRSSTEVSEKEDVPFRQYKQTSALASGHWYKIGVGHPGIYRITYSDMQSMGFDVGTLDPAQIGVYGMGGGMLPESNAAPRIDDLEELSIHVEGQIDGSFDPSDYILFYAEGPHTWSWSNYSFRHKKHLYDDRNCYFITVGSASGERIGAEPSISAQPTHTVTGFNDRKFHELDSSNLIKSGKQWYGEEFFNQISYTIPFSFQNLIGGNGVILRSAVAARSTVSSTFSIDAGGSTLTPSLIAISPSYNSAYATSSTDTMTFYPGSDNFDIDVTYHSSSASAKGWLNYLELNARRQLSFTGGQMSFRDVRSTGPGNIAEFIIDNCTQGVVLWEATNGLHPKVVDGSYSGGEYRFTLETDTLREFIAFDGSNYFTPQFIGAVANQNLHGIGQYDMVILTYPAFRAQAERLANLHRDKDSLTVFVVEPGLIYNEFSSGVKDITAIRDFMKMLYDRAPIPEMAPKYLLLLGDASYDPKDRTEDNTDFIPTFQSSQSLHPAYSYATDDYFGLLDDNEGGGAGGHLDVGIGRFPVQTLAEATEMTDKIFRYIDRTEHISSTGVASTGDWRNIVCFVGDDEDSNLHMLQADQLATYVDTAYRDYNLDKIYIDAYQQVVASGGQRYPEAQEAINRRVAKGALLINYTGHGGEVGWALERILEVADINSWDNTWNMPAFVTATCEFSRYDDPGRISAGELAFLNPDGGAIALFTTSRLAFSSSNFNLNKSFFEVALPKTGDHPYTMGDIIRLAKVGAGSPSSNRNFLLIGDPALKLSYPENRVTTTEINGSPVGSGPDTLRALDLVTIGGEITDWSGNKLSSFNGIIYPTVYDKASQLSTLGNDPQSSPVPFNLQKNILYKGKVSVTNGQFEFSFIVPKDIAYNFGNGRISYYANDGFTDAHGNYEGFIVGGTAQVSSGDNQGPELNLFMNDTNFIDGGITDENPVLLVHVSDLHGINTVGNGIGHDLVAIMDGESSRPFVLNDFYESDLDSYTSGKVRYPLHNLATGDHVIIVRAWDVYNNSSVDSIHFTVNPSEQVILDSISNYPNPFTEYTDIWFEHNVPGDEITARVEIIDLGGRIIEAFDDIPMGDGYRTGPVRWYGQTSNGSFARNGMYFYRVSVIRDGSVLGSLTGKTIMMR